MCSLPLCLKQENVLGKLSPDHVKRLFAEKNIMDCILCSVKFMYWYYNSVIFGKKEAIGSCRFHNISVLTGETMTLIFPSPVASETNKKVSFINQYAITDSPTLKPKYKLTILYLEKTNYFIFKPESIWLVAMFAIISSK